MLRLLAIVFCLCIAGTLAARAETPLPPESFTLEDAVRRGLERHPLLQASQHEALEAEAATKQLEAANYPRVTGVFANTGGNTRVLANLGVSGSLPKPTNYLTTPGVRVDLLVTDFGYTAHRILASKALAASAKNNTLTVKAVVILNIQQAYLTCLKEQRLTEIAQEVLRERRLIRDQTETFYRHQLRSKLDLDFAAVEVNRAEVALLKARNALKTAFANLNYTMGRQGPAEYRLGAVPLSVAPAEPIEPLFQQALEKRPELLGNSNLAQFAEEAVKAARALNFGSVTAIGTAGYTWWGREEQPSGRDVSNPWAQLGWWGAGGTSSFPIYAGGRIEGQNEEAEARKGEVAAMTRGLANDIMLQVTRAYLSRMTTGQQIQVDRERVAYAREALTLARERYKNALGSILDVTTATMDLLQAEVGLAESQYNYELSQAAVRYAVGADYAAF